MRNKINLIALIAVAATVAYFSIAPVGGSAPNGTFSFVHLAAYFVLSGAFLLHFHDTNKGHVEAVLAAGAFGIAIEAVQYGIPYRTFALHDIALNFVGASIVLMDHRVGAVTWFVRVEDLLIERAISHRF